MNLLQAIEQAGDNWFRSIEFHDACFFISGGYIFRVNDNSIGLCIFSLEAALGEWEIVAPEKVAEDWVK